MVQTGSLFRRRLTVDAHVKVAADQLVAAHSNQARDSKIGKIFEPFYHNYLYGVTLNELVERIVHLVKRENKSLQQIWLDMGWINVKNREDARSLSVMGISKDEWSVRFAEIVMLDNKEESEKQNQALMWMVPAELALFYYIFGPDWKTFLFATGAGIGLSEASHIYKYNRGFSIISFTWYGVMLQQLYATNKIFSIPTAAVIFLMLAPLVSDPPAPGQWKTMEGVRHTAHDLHYGTFIIAALLRQFKII